ncbi:MAG: hypothetical protein V5A88_00710 [Candidatus Thermoplasmatota archaeon]
MAENSESKCPVCDSKIPQDRDECPNCGADLSLFGEDMDLDDDISEDAMEKVMGMVMEEEEVDSIDDIEDLDMLDDELDEEEIEEGEERGEELQDELIEDIKDLGLSEDELGEGIEEQAEREEEMEEDTERIITFECPICESEVSENASECPNCGVVFEEEEEEGEEEEEYTEMEDVEYEGIEWEEDTGDEKSSEEKDDIYSDFEELDSILDEQMKEEERVRDFQERVESFEEKIESLEDFDITVDEIKSDLDGVRNAFEEDEEERGKTLLGKIEERIECAENIRQKIKRCRNYIKWISQKSDTSDLKGWVKDVLRGCEIGEYKVASKKACEVEEDIEEVAEDMGIKKGDELKKYIEEKENSVRNKLSKIDEVNLDIDTEGMEEELEAASEERDIIECFHHIMNAKRESKELYEISKKVEEAEDYIEKLKENDIEHEEYSDNLDHVKERAQKGDISGALEEGEKTVDELKKRLEKEDIAKETKEETVEIVKKKKKETIEKEGEKDLKKVQQKIPNMKELLVRAQEFSIDTEGGKELINEAVKKTKQNDYEEAIQSLNECEEFFQRKLDKKIEEEIDEIKESDEDDVQSTVEKIDEFRENEEYEKIKELLEKEKGKSEVDEEALEPVKEELSEIEETITMGEKLDLKFPEARDLLEEAKEKCEKGDVKGSQNTIEQIQNKAFEKLKDVLKEEIKDAQDKLKKAKIQGAEISKPVKLLKKTNNARKEEDLKESVKYFKDFKDNMEEIRAEL